MARRQLMREQRREIIFAPLQQTPGMSDRQIAEGLGVSHHTVGDVREGGERCGQIAHVDRVADSLGRSQPRGKTPALTPQRKVEAIVLDEEDIFTLKAFAFLYIL